MDSVVATVVCRKVLIHSTKERGKSGRKGKEEEKGRIPGILTRGKQPMDS